MRADIKAFAMDPTAAVDIKKLKGYKPPQWRIRRGNYRIIFTIDKKRRWLIVKTADDRKNAY